MKYWMIPAGFLLVALTSCVIDLRSKPAHFGFIKINQQPRQVELELPDTDPQASMPESLTGTWKSSGDWAGGSSGMSLQFILKNETSHWQTGLWLNENELLAARIDTATPCDIARPAGRLTLNGNIRTETTGTFVFTPDRTWRESLEALLDQPPTTGQYLHLWSSSIELSYAQDLKTELGDRFTLDALLTLGRNGVSIAYIATLKQQGYDFSVDDLVKLHRYGISADYAGTFKSAGYDFNAEDLIKTNRYSLRAEQFTAFRAGGYDFDIDTLIKANRYGINPDQAARYREAGYDFSLDELIEVNRYGLRPEQFIKFREAGYDFDIDTLIKANRYGINPDQAARFHQAGYNFTLDDLIELNRYGITPDFAAPLHNAGYRFSVAELIELRRYGIATDFIVALADPEYENFTAAEIIAMKNNGMSAATLKKIRQKKPVASPDNSQ